MFLGWLCSGFSEEPVQQDKEAAGSGGRGTWEAVTAVERKKQPGRKKGHRKVVDLDGDDEHGGAICERQREHPFIVTEPGEVARGKKNGLDYLFHLYEQCRDFLIQVQNIAKERGEKCPTKVLNNTFRPLISANFNTSMVLVMDPHRPAIVFWTGLELCPHLNLPFTAVPIKT